MSTSVLIQSRRRPLSLIVLALAGAVLITGCAKQRTEGYYNPPRASSSSDAWNQAQGSDYLPLVQAPSQLQIELKAPPPGQARKSDPTAEQAAQKQAVADARAEASAEAAGSTSAAAHALVPQAQTYTGTLPCMTPSTQCAAQRITLTLAPNGRWRSRSANIDSAGTQGTPFAQQGCWDATAERPPRVLLADAAGNQRIELIVSANNVLRVGSVLGVTPNLNYSLKRQPDLDPIDELSKEAAPKCV